MGSYEPTMTSHLWESCLCEFLFPTVLLLECVSIHSRRNGGNEYKRTREVLEGMKIYLGGFPKVLRHRSCVWPFTLLVCQTHTYTHTHTHTHTHIGGFVWKLSRNLVHFFWNCFFCNGLSWNIWIIRTLFHAVMRFTCFDLDRVRLSCL